jgi:hypothetical protein
MAITKTIVTKLTLDSKKFANDLKGAQKVMVQLGAAAVGIGTAISVLTQKTAFYQDEMIKSSRTIGTAVEDFLGYVHAAEKAGAGTEVLIKSLAKLNAPTKLISDTMAGLGIKLKNVDGTLREQKEVLFDLADVFKDNLSAVERSAAAYNLFGMRGVALVNFLKDGSEALKENAEEARKLGLIFSTEAGIAAENYIDSTTRLTASIRGITTAIGESFIEMSNQSNIINDISFFIGRLANEWRSLDKDTKDIILTITTLSIGMGLLSVAIVGMIKLAPTLGKAFSIMFGPIGLIITAIGLLAIGFLKFKDQVMPILEPIAKAFNELADSATEMGRTMTSMFDSLSGAFDIIESDSESASVKISLFGTIVVSTFKVIGSIVLIAIRAFDGLIKVLDLLAISMNADLQAMKALMTGSAKDFQFWSETSSKAVELAGNQINITGKKINRDLKNIWKDGILIYNDTKEGATSKKIEQMFDNIKNSSKSASDSASKGWEDFNIQIEAMANELPSVFDVIIGAVLGAVNTLTAAASTIVSVFRMAAELEVSALQYSLAIMERDFEIRMNNLQEGFDTRMRITAKFFDEQIKAEEQQTQREIDELNYREQQKIAILENAKNERLLQLDNEFQKMKAARERAFQEEMEFERAKFEAEKALLLEKAIDAEQRRLTEKFMNEDWKKFLEMREQQHQDTLSQFTEQYLTNKENQEEKSDNKILQIKDKFDSKKERKQKKSDDKLLELQTERDRLFLEMQTNYNDAQKALEREQAQAVWQNTKAQFDATKEVRIAEAWVTGFSAAAEAYSSLAKIPLLGPPLGAAAAAKIMDITRKRVKQIGKQKPIKPAILMQEGGVLSDTIPANLHPGEGVIDRIRTRKLIDLFDNITEDNSRRLNIIFESNSVVINGNAEDDLLSKLSEGLAREIEIRGVA